MTSMAPPIISRRPRFVAIAAAQALLLLALPSAAAERRTEVLLSLDGTERAALTYDGKDRQRFLPADKADSVDGNGSLHFGGTSPVRQGSKYFGVSVALPEPIDLARHRVMFHARTNHPGTTAAFYVRGYNRGQKEPALSYNSWDSQLSGSWREFRLQAGLSMTGLVWERDVVGDRMPTAVDRFEFIIGTREDNVPVDVLLDNVRIAPGLLPIGDLQSVPPRSPDTPLAVDGKAVATILHPDSDAGRRAAGIIAASIADRRRRDADGSRRHRGRSNARPSGHFPGQCGQQSGDAPALCPSDDPCRQRLPRRRRRAGAHDRGSVWPWGQCCRRRRHRRRRPGPSGRGARRHHRPAGEGPLGRVTSPLRTALRPVVSQAFRLGR